MLIRLAGLLTVFSTALTGQSLGLSSASASRGHQVIIELSLASPAGKEPLALQWDVQVPIEQLTLMEDKLLPGSTAEEAGKSIHCAVKEKTAGTYTLGCLIAGGLNPIPNGTIAMLRIKIAANAQTGPAPVRVLRGLAVSKDLKQVPLEAVETKVTISK